MKFILTESKLEQIIFKYLDNQDFVILERSDKICFLNSKGDKYSQITYIKSNGQPLIDFNLKEEISSIFSLKSDDSEMIIGKWVENTLQMNVSNTAGKFLQFFNRS